MPRMENYRVPSRWVGGITLIGAADVDKIVTTTNMKVGAYTIAAQPTAPGRVSVSATAGDTADTMGTIVVVGKVRGQTDSETIVPKAGEVVYGTKYFESITSVTGEGWVIDDVEGTNDTITVGISEDSAIYIGGQNATITDTSGNIYIHPKEKATAANGYPMAANEELELVVHDYLYLTPDSSGGTLKYIVWES